MKILLLIHLLFAGFYTHGSDSDTLISCHFNQTPFTEFCQEIYRQTGKKIYYQDAWVHDIRVTMNEEGITVLSAVEMALLGTNLTVSAWNDGLVILPGEGLPDRLPYFKTQLVSSDSATEENKVLTQSEERYLIGRKADVLQTLQVGKKGITGKNSWVTIRGRITVTDPNYVDQSANTIAQDIYADWVKNGMLKFPPVKK